METYKRLRKNPLSVIGKDEDGNPVVSGFFALVDGQGIPLDIVLRFFHEQSFTPCWLTFFMESPEKGWNPQPTLTKIQVACEDAYEDIFYAKMIVGKLKDHIGI